MRTERRGAPTFVLPRWKRGRWVRLAQALCLAGVVVCLTAFLRFFNYTTAQARIDSLWLVALVLWFVAVWLQPSTARAERVVHLVDLSPLLLIVPVFAACWLPFHDNWRWAYTGDSFGIYGSGWWFGTKGPQQSLLSVHGIDDFYTYLWEVSYNWPMYVFHPTLFWHRVGQLVMACLALSAIYTFYCAMLGRLWATAITVGTATNYVWIWISYISYLRTDSFVIYYLTLLCGFMLWRTPQSLILWAVTGLIGGLALFYTPVTWGAVVAVATICSVRAFVRRVPAGPLVYVVSFLLAASPIVSELPWMLQMLRLQSVAGPTDAPWALPDPQYVWDMFRTILQSPYDSPIYILGVNGAFHRWPMGYLYLAGIAMAALSVVPFVRRAFRLPAIVPVLLCLYLWDAALFSLTNKGYGSPSHKRFYNLIPLQVLFALVPLYIAHAWCAVRPILRGFVVALLLASLTSAAALGLDIIMYPRPFMYGYNVFDGVIEIHQRWPGRDVLVLSPRHMEDLGPGGSFDDTYGIAQRMRVVDHLDAELLNEACRARQIVCYEITEEAAPLFEHDTRWTERSLLNCRELYCYDCMP